MLRHNAIEAWIHMQKNSLDVGDKLQTRRPT